MRREPDASGGPGRYHGSISPASEPGPECGPASDSLNPPSEERLRRSGVQVS